MSLGVICIFYSESCINILTTKSNY
uniref:Uncharacterized protein n=1 Tax=Arundo donax TaxID=35708 RepID=A0A0A8ZRF5_ARUDO